MAANRMVMSRGPDVQELMVPGPGTPWEDRGSKGVLAGFLRTCWMGLTRPARLLWAIRRPETSSDATAFAVGCGLLWGVSVLVHNVILYRHYAAKPQVSVLGDLWWFSSALQALAAAGATVLAVRFIARMFHKLVSAGDMKSPVPPVLVANVLGYCLGPALLAPIPYVGPFLALVWTVGLFIGAAIGRLRASVAGAIVCILIAVACAAGLGVAAYLAGWYLWGHVTGGAILWPQAPQRPY